MNFLMPTPYSPGILFLLPVDWRDLICYFIYSHIIFIIYYTTATVLWALYYITHHHPSLTHKYIANN